jgi:peptidoglycan L-alanyl-D-glutamate endopeptidase CwlK
MKDGFKMPTIFNSKSLIALTSCHQDLQLIANETKRLCLVSFQITEGHRTPELQNKYFKEGKSKIDGIKQKSKHNYFPSLAFDFYIDILGKPELAYDVDHLMYVIGSLMTVSAYLKEQRKITYAFRSGANWDDDGILIKDQTFQDLPNVELF